MKKQALMKAHRQLVKSGKFYTARLILEFLRKKSIWLGPVSYTHLTLPTIA